MSAADPAATILLVEDDAPTRTFLADNLTADGYELLVADYALDWALENAALPRQASGSPTAAGRPS
jgi:DNA-binding response OmpR family regulator